MTQKTETIELDEFWDAPKLRRRPPSSRAQTSNPTWEGPPQQSVQKWVQHLDTQGSILLAIEGPDPICRAEGYRWIYDQCLGWTAGDSGNLDTNWVQEGFVSALTDRVAFATRDGSWQLFHALLDVENFVIQEPLYSLVDQGFRFTEFFKAVWEVRSLLQENREGVAGKLAQALIQWMTAKPLSAVDRELLGKAQITRELEGAQERLDMLFFLLALAQQNGLIDRTVVVFDSFEKALHQGTNRRRELLREMLIVTDAAERWTRLGARVGVVLGFTKDHGTMVSLKRYSPKLHKKVRRALHQAV